MEEMPAEHVGGVTAFAVTVTGVATELPFAGAVIVTMPFEVEPNAHEGRRTCASGMLQSGVEGLLFEEVHIVYARGKLESRRIGYPEEGFRTM